MNIAPGNYIVRPLRCTVTTTKAGDPQVAVELAHAEDGPHKGTEDVWFGSLKDEDKAAKTAATLRECGWTGEDIFAVTFPETARMRAVYQDDQDQNGNPVVRLRWLNALSRGYRELPADRHDEVRKRVAAALRVSDANQGRVPQSATPRPTLPEVLRPILATVPEGTDATTAARVWAAHNKTLIDGDRLAFWRELGRLVPGGPSALTAAVKQLTAPPPSVSADAPPPAF